MFREREDIINTLENARRLITEKPELLKMEKEDILDTLDDGSSEMLGYRWGVVAYAYIGELSDFSFPTIINAFQNIKSGVLTYEYIGYILQSEHETNLVDLLLYASENGIYDKILPFVQSNLVFEKTFNPEKLSDFIDAYYENNTKNNQEQILINYAELIVLFDGEKNLCQKVIATEDSKYYDLLLYVSNEVYAKDYQYADELMEMFLNSDSEICKKLAIVFVSRSLRYHCETFEMHFAVWNNLVKESTDYWKMIIPAYTDYLLYYRNGKMYRVVLEGLKYVTGGTTEEKAIFISHICYKDNINADMEHILDELMEKPFEKNKQILDCLDWIFYKKLTKGAHQEVLDKMQQIFSANDYKQDSADFFDTLDSTCSEFRGFQNILLKVIIQKIAYGSEEEFYFAIGLFSECAVWKKVRENLEEQKYPEEVLELVVLGLLYYSHDAKMVCSVAFQLTGLLDKEWDKYFASCKNEIYRNYPYTMNEYAKQFIENADEKTKKLAAEIISLHRLRLQHVEIGNRVQDLHPSAKRSEEYQRAKREQEKRIKQISDKKGVFLNLFPNRIMKYGKRNAFIQIGRHNEWSYQVRNYAEFSYEIELPQEYMKDQLQYAEMRNEYLERRNLYAINH